MGGAKRFSAFALVGASGVVVNVVAMWVLHGAMVNYLVAAVLATQIAIAWNFLLSELFVFKDWRGHHTLGRRTWRYFLVNNIDTLVRIPLLAVLVQGLGMRPSPANFLIIVAAAGIKYVFVSRLVYRKPAPSFSSDPAVVAA